MNIACIGIDLGKTTFHLVALGEWRLRAQPPVTFSRAFDGAPGGAASPTAH
jgi:hypothetical protein